MSTRNDSFHALTNKTKKQEAVFNAIAEQDGCTLFELCNLMQLPVNSVSGRVTELKDAERIIDSGNRRVNPASGRKAIVWRAA